MYNDDLSGVVVGVNVIRALLKRTDLRYTYRFLIVPETIGSLAFLSHHEQLIPNMRGGMFLEMLGLPHPHALQRSFAADTEMDRCCSLALRDLDADAWVGEFRKVIGNDERQFNAPGVRVPMVSLSRCLPRDSPDWPYRTYHCDQDRPDDTLAGQLDQSVDVVLGIIDALEHSREPARGGAVPRRGREPVPVPRYKGELFCSRYGLRFDDLGRYLAFGDILCRIDGTRTAVEIAEECGAERTDVQSILDELVRRDLVHYVDPLLSIRPVTDDDCRLIWEWSNDAEVRRWSFDSESIEWETHVAWFKSRRGDPTYLMYVLTKPDGEPVGLARFELSGGSGVVGISIAAEHRGHGYATAALRLACATFFATSDAADVIAEIKPGNEASVRAFERAGLSHRGRVQVKGQDAIRMTISRAESGRQVTGDS
jgi:RimJ/RimL family protein N-acetyltransferase